MFFILQCLCLEIWNSIFIDPKVTSKNNYFISGYLLGDSRPDTNISKDYSQCLLQKTFFILQGLSLEILSPTRHKS